MSILSLQITYFSFTVYVFLGEHNGMIDMLTNLEERGLFDTGEYMLIHTDFETFDMNRPLKYFQRKSSTPTRNVM